jgi:hypothetical protein
MGVFPPLEEARREPDSSYMNLYSMGEFIQKPFFRARRQAIYSRAGLHWRNILIANHMQFSRIGLRTANLSSLWSKTAGWA